jgi:nucleoside-diphosphate-sugar epimerase
MNVLFIGGTGIISTACTELAIARGLNVTVLNRSLRAPVAGARSLSADCSQPAALAAALAGTSWDAVVDFIAFTPADVASRLEALRGRTGQYVFISSASAYQKPPPITSSPSPRRWPTASGIIPATRSRARSCC